MNAKGGSAHSSAEVDGWPSRLAKLIPAEALGLYGAGQAIVPEGRSDGILVLAILTLIFSGVIRYVATRDQNNKPQWAAIAIAMISFILWLLTLHPPAGPINLGANAFYAALASILWVTVVPIFYRGSAG